MTDFFGLINVAYTEHDECNVGYVAWKQQVFRGLKWRNPDRLVSRDVGRVCVCVRGERLQKI